MVQAIGLSMVTFALSFLGVVAVRKWAERREILLALPNERSSHVHPTPHGGGLAIVVVTLLAWIVYEALTVEALRWVPYVLGALVVAVVSWLDDLYTVSTWKRLLIHGIAAVLAIVSFDYWHGTSLELFSQPVMQWVGLILTFCWIVGLTNAYNFMDGIDGIAGLQAVVVGTGWAVLGLMSHQTEVSVMGLLLAATSLGFLIHNWSPARIFMGDVGSAFLGYTFAVLPLIAAHTPNADSRLALFGMLLLWPFIFDTLFTFFRRALRRENVLAAHRTHLYQRLISAGCGHRFVTLLYGGFAVIGVALAVARTANVPGNLVAIVTIVPALCIGLWGYVVVRERKEASRSGARATMIEEKV